LIGKKKNGKIGKHHTIGKGEGMKGARNRIHEKRKENLMGPVEGKIVR